MAFDFNQWYFQKINGDIIYKYSGAVTSEKISESLNEVENSLKASNIKSHKKKKIYNILVECIQNLYHHADIPPSSAEVEVVPKFGVIVLAKDHSFFRISTGNFIKSENMIGVEDRIKMINSLSDEDIVVVYRDILTHEESTSKSTGLGLLDMVRKTGNKLEYYIYSHNDNYSFLSLDVYIS